MRGRRRDRRGAVSRGAVAGATRGGMGENVLRESRRREVVRGTVAVACFAIVSLVVLVLVGVLLHMGQTRSAPPARTLIVSQSGDFVLLDPALAQSAEAWELEYATCAKL